MVGWTMNAGVIIMSAALLTVAMFSVVWAICPHNANRSDLARFGSEGVRKGV